MKLRKAGSNWVDGDRFFDRVGDIEALEEQVRDGAHTLLTAQWRMGKTSLVRELLRRFGDGEDFEPIFVDLERAADPADAIAETGACSQSARGVWHRVKSVFANMPTGKRSRIASIPSKIDSRCRAFASSVLSTRMRRYNAPSCANIRMFGLPCWLQLISYRTVVPNGFP